MALVCVCCVCCLLFYMSSFLFSLPFAVLVTHPLHRMFGNFVLLPTQRAATARAEHEARLDELQQRRDVRALVAHARVVLAPPQPSGAAAAAAAAALAHRPGDATALSLPPLATPAQALPSPRAFLKRSSVSVVHPPATPRTSALASSAISTHATTPSAPSTAALVAANTASAAARSARQRKTFAPQLLADEAVMSEAALAAQINALESLAERVRSELETSLQASIAAMRPSSGDAAAAPRPPSASALPTSRPLTAVPALPSARSSHATLVQQPQPQHTPHPPPSGSASSVPPPPPPLSVLGGAAPTASRPTTARRAPSAGALRT